MRYLNSYIQQQLVICILLTNTLSVHFPLIFKNMWHAIILFIRSFLACTTRTVQCHQFPELTILSHVSCFIQEEVIGFQVLLNSLHPCSMRASRYFPPVLQGKIFSTSVSSGIHTVWPKKHCLDSSREVWLLILLVNPLKPTVAIWVQL